MHSARDNTPHESIRTIIVKSSCECIMRVAGELFKFNVGSTFIKLLTIPSKYFHSRM